MLLGNVHKGRPKILGHFGHTYLPMSNVFYTMPIILGPFLLRYLPTPKSDVLYECSLMQHCACAACIFTRVFDNPSLEESLFNFSIAQYNLWTIINCLSCSLKRWMQDQKCYTKAIRRLHCTCALLWIKINKGWLENWNWLFLKAVFRNTFSRK